MSSLNRKKRILTGIRQTGELHLGHYIGALQNWVKLQDDYNCYFLIADYQALGDHFHDIELIRDSVLKVTLDWLAVGLDPEKSSFVVQSYVPEFAELSMLLSFITPLGMLERNPTLKTELDALQYSQDGLFGNARFTAMSGAFGALGGDFSSIVSNPAGVAVFTKNEFSKQNINCLKRIIKLCEEKKIKLILVIAPFYSEKLNYEKKEFDLWKSNIKKNINNIEIIDFSLSFTNKKFFNDWKHINKKGTQEFNKIFFKNRIISDILL